MTTTVRHLFCVLLLSAATGAAGAAENDLPRFHVESAVWCSGELRGQPELLLEPGRSGQFEIDAPDSRWRLSVEVESPSENEGAGPDAVWLKIDIEEFVNGHWEFITDTMLGVPLGQPGRITVVDQAEAGSDPDQVPLYVEITTTAVEPEANGG